MNTHVYLLEFADEQLPCEATLEAWAKWLSAPDEAWGRETAAIYGKEPAHG